MGNKRWLVFPILIGIIVVGVGVAVYSQAGQEITRFEANRPLPGAVLYDQNGAVIKRLGKGSVFVPLNKIPPELRNAVEATQKNVPQQVAQLIFEPRGTWDRLKSAVLPYILKRRYSNQELVELYLNQAYFGERAYGVEAASQTYFGKPVEQVGLAESALLAALTLEPESASPYQKPQRAVQLRNNILSQMQSAGRIEKAKYEQAINTPLDLEHHEPGQAHYFADYLSKILVDKLGEERVFQGGLKIETTLDLGMQKAAEQALQKHNIPGAMVVIDPQDGRILALVGGLNYVENKTNLATTKQKMVGTTLRPLIYATGLKEEWA